MAHFAPQALPYGADRVLMFKQDTLRDETLVYRPPVVAYTTQLFCSGTANTKAMADYFSEYSTFAGNRLPSPADTPYETPGYLRSKRSSRVGSSREQSTTPPPLPSDPIDSQEKSRDGRYSGVDPRRFTPTLHASLVSEILNLRREIDSKNNLVENLETALSQTRDDNDSLAGKLSESAKEIRKAKQQVQQLEQGSLNAVEDLAKERDAAKSAFHEIRSKFEVTQKKTRVQDDDAVRAQTIWESEKESWDNERRQLERRVHVTESRLRAVLDEMASQQNQAMQSDEAGDDAAFKDSGMGEGSDTASIRSAAPASPVKHKRNMSSISFRPRNVRSSVSSRGTAATPDLYGRSGNTLADELGIDEEDEYDDDEYDNGDVDLDLTTGAQRVVESRQSLRKDEIVVKARGANGLSNGTTNQEYDRSLTPPPAVEAPTSVSQVKYVDSGYQPSPPPSPPRVVIAHHHDDKAGDECVRSAENDPNSELPPPASGLQTRVAVSPISPPQTPVVDDGTWLATGGAPEVVPSYHTASTQTEPVAQSTQPGHTPKQDSLSPPNFVPSIAIHPPSSRPSSPRPYVLPPGTKNAASQANINCAYKDAGMQTAEIRVDKRSVKLAAHLLPSHLLPSPPLSETASRPKLVVSADSQKTLTKSSSATAAPAPVPFQSPVDPSTEMSRSSKDLRSYPLKAIALPRPVLSPLASPSLPQAETHNSNGPLNRSSQYGVSQLRSESQPLADDFDPWSSHSDYEGRVNDFEADFASSIPGLSRPPPGRFGLSEPPKAVPEDKEISPERRPATAGSERHAPGPSLSNSRPSSQSRPLRLTSKPGKTEIRRDPRARSPSFGSLASSQSAPSGTAAPPFPIPLRRSSRTVTKPRSDGSQSPLSYEFAVKRGSRTGPTGHNRQVSLRKVQSAAIIRTRTGRVSPQKGHRQRRRTPNLTPVQSMAFEEPPMPTDFPIPDLPTPLQDTLKYMQGSVDMGTSVGSAPRASEETNLVDAIAGTMVGEWMWKYIRKRKSFGIGDDTDLPVADQNGFMNSTGHGTRHKRWVWLSPYERTIMWDSKQPTSGPALLGKKGRKCRWHRALRASS